MTESPFHGVSACREAASPSFQLSRAGSGQKNELFFLSIPI